MKLLGALNIPVVFVDNSVAPVPGAADSVTLLGKVLDRPAEARAYTDFYSAHLAALQTVIAQIPQPHPSVFVEALAGQNDAGGCCFTHGDFGWGLLVNYVGAKNLATGLLHTPSGMVSMEALLASQPDVFVMTGHAPGSPATPGFGYQADPAQLASSMAALTGRTGFAALRAVQDEHVFGIYHAFYSSAYNIVGLEFLAKFIYPESFQTLDPAATYAALIGNFTMIPGAPAILGQQAMPLAR
jgi:iron complex transport system substrate-binding protein